MEHIMKFTVLGFFALFIIAELIWARFQKKSIYNPKETLSNIIILTVNQLLKPLVLVWSFMVFSWVGKLTLLQLPNHWAMYVLAAIMVDFLLYWQHRIHHEVALLWTIHNVHHSSPWMNFTTAFRINWIGGFISPVFFLPAILLGFTPTQVTGFLFLNLVYQFLLHTESVGKIPFLEGWLNTPSAHRVHHGSNPKYIDKNYGGVLMIWDRMFRTYQAEEEEVVYGVTTGFEGHNPVWAVFGPMVRFFKGEFQREKRNVGTFIDPD